MRKIFLLIVCLCIVLSGCSGLPAGGVPPLPSMNLPVQILPGQVELLQPGTTLDMLLKAVTTGGTDTLRMAKGELILLGGHIKGVGWGFACFNGDSPCSYQVWKMLTGGKANVVSLDDYTDLVHYLKAWCGWETIKTSQVPAALVKSIKDGFAAKMGSSNPVFIFMIPAMFELPDQILPPAGEIE